ncbi:MAG: hypothetical protein ACTSWY_09215 [Promethearchaeota archaeon]
MEKQDLTVMTKNTVKNIIGQKLEKLQDMKKHQCPYCGQKFIKESFLKSHLQIRHNKVENVEIKSNYVNVKSRSKSFSKSSVKKTWDIPEVSNDIKQINTSDLNNLSDKELKQIEAAINSLEQNISKSSINLKQICETLMVELKYMISEYKSPFINI